MKSNKWPEILYTNQGNGMLETVVGEEKLIAYVYPGELLEDAKQRLRNRAKRKAAELEE